MVRCVALLSLLLLTTLAAPLAAQEAEASSTEASSTEVSSSDSEARVRFEAGRMAFAAERYEDALADFERAYELSHRGVLLFNIAQSLARLGRNREAVERYTAFLSASAEGDAGRDDARSQIEILNQAIADAGTEPVDEGEHGPPATSAAPGDPTTGWVLVGVGGAVTIVGAVLAGLGLADRALVESPPPETEWRDAMEAYERGPILEATGFSALAVGLVGLTVGLVLVLTTPGGVASDDLASGTFRWSL